KAESRITSIPVQNDLNWRPAGPQKPSGSSRTTTTFNTSSVDGESESRTGSSQTAGEGKQALDVDAFKRLLLTGESGKGASSGASAPPASAFQPMIQGDSSSSTADSASVSRQSIFEPITTGTSMETPR